VKISFFRTVRTSGDSLVVSIPYELAEREAINEGSRVWVILRKIGSIRVKAHFKKRRKT
jgi:antitoxin component of MazEF toxin-antitoxin module